MRELLIQCPDGQMKSVPLTGERMAVGRSSSSELCFPEDAGLSRQHFAFETQGAEWTVQDLGSKNGTFVNNIPLKAKLILKPGDRITAGHLVITFAPDGENPKKGVVVFDGGQAEFAQHLDRDHQPGGRQSDHRIDRRGRRARRPRRPCRRSSRPARSFPRTARWRSFSP